jgi:hypothetical protein
VVFARWDEVQAAMADAVLNLPELAGLPSAIAGTTDLFITLHLIEPTPEDRLMNRLETNGSMSDGRSFWNHASESQPGTRCLISIR